MIRLFKTGITIVAICLISIFLVRDFSFAEVKFGYVDLNKIFNNYRKTIKADEELEKIQEKKQKEREKLVSQVRKLKDEMELLSDEGKKKKQQEINQKIKELQEFDRDTRNKLLKKRDDAAKEIIDELDIVIKDMGKKEGYTFIFNERFILYGDKSYDLTDKVLKTLNKRYKDR